MLTLEEHYQNALAVIAGKPFGESAQDELGTVVVDGEESTKTMAAFTSRSPEEIDEMIHNMVRMGAMGMASAVSAGSPASSGLQGSTANVFLMGFMAGVELANERNQQVSVN